MNDLRDQLTSHAPPGAAKLLGEHFDQFDPVVVQIPPEVVRGRVKFQISTVRLSVTDGSSSEITLHADVRARYYPDENTSVLPAPIHGEVRATFEVSQTGSGATTKLVVQPSPVDSKIQFIAAPGSGLDAVEASRLSAELRRVLRHDFKLLPVDLCRRIFRSPASRAWAAAARRSWRCRSRCQGDPIPPNRLHTITQQFVGPTGFGFAASKEHVLSLIDLEAIKESIKTRKSPSRSTCFSVRSTSTIAFASSRGRP